MSRLSWLEKEADIWIEKGIITREQAGRIMDLYSRDGRSRLVAALLVLGAVLLGAGVSSRFTWRRGKAKSWNDRANWTCWSGLTGSGGQPSKVSLPGIRGIL